MALIVDARNAGEKAKQYQFEAGMALLAIGVGEVSEANIDEVEFRLRIVGTLMGNVGFTSQELLGVKINAITESFTKWINRMRKVYVAEIHADRVGKKKGGKK